MMFFVGRCSEDTSEPLWTGQQQRCMFVFFFFLLMEVWKWTEPSLT